MTTLEERLKDYELVVKGQALGGWPLPAVDIEWLIAALRNEREKRVGADAMLKEIVEGLRAGAKVAKAQEDEAEQKKRALFKCDSQ